MTVALVILTAITCCAMNNDDALVTIPDGRLQGMSAEGVVSFKGIPFAAPPVGNLRWKAPQPVTPWEGILVADKFGPEPVQPGRNGKIAANSSEDCLYLNIWKPAGGNHLPVMVWIYGGAFVAGSGADPMFDGTNFAKDGVLFVTFNYRLGNLGFFAFPGNDEDQGSFAYMDMIAALKWVKANIAAFGGDPDNITIFGESAGGVSVHSMLTIPSARGLFNKAIIESGGGRRPVLSGVSLADAEKNDVAMARSLGVDGLGKHALDSLRLIPADSIILSRYGNGPIIDGDFVKQDFESAYYAGQFAHVPLIIGSNSAESPTSWFAADSKDELFSIFGKYSDEAKKIYDPDGKTDLRTLGSMVTTDKVWAEPARFTAKTLTRAGVPVYVYMFSYVADDAKKWSPLGAMHASELPYVFETLNTRWGVDDITASDNEISKLIHMYWTNFAKHGTPDGAGVPYWPRYTLASPHIMNFTAQGNAQAIPEAKPERLDIVEKAFGSENNNSSKMTRISSLLTTSGEMASTEIGTAAPLEDVAVTAGNVPVVKLNNGTLMPRFGLGTFLQGSDSICEHSCLTALKAGYRHIDTAHAYDDERGVGRAVKESGVPRDEIWITSKLWPTEYGEGITAKAIDKMLQRLDTDYIDLLYVHQPVGDFVGAWRDMEKAVEAGKVRALGISNFDANDSVFNLIMNEARIKPAVLQMECHPYAQRLAMREKVKPYDIQVECWFPLGGAMSQGALLKDTTILRIAEAHGKTPAQVILRWHIQEGFSVIPGATNPDYIRENIDIFDFNFTDEDMAAIRALNKEQRFFNATYEQVEQFGKMPMKD